MDRIWGKAMQTDAKVSPTNYGGPLVDLFRAACRASWCPRRRSAEGETAGFEWYDSGIGFAVPLEDINAVLPRLKQGTDLKRGISASTSRVKTRTRRSRSSPRSQPGSAADKAGINPGDRIAEIDGKPVETQVQLQNGLASKYEGDTIAVKIDRAGKEVNLPAVALAARWPRSVRRFSAYCRCATIRARASRCAMSIRIVRRRRPGSRSAIASSASTARRCPANRPASSRSSTATVSST